MIAHSKDPLCWSGLMPKTASIQSGTSKVIPSNVMLVLPRVASIQKRARCPVRVPRCRPARPPRRSFDEFDPVWFPILATTFFER
jgi:hypothetical protein